MEQKMFVRLCEGLNDYGKFVPSTVNIYKLISNKDKDYYTSMFMYNEEQKDEFIKNGSIKGIRDVVSNRLMFDFDMDGNLQQSYNDTIEMVNILNRRGISDKSIEAYFSGKKGFHVSVNIEQQLTPKQIRGIAVSLAGHLPSFDSSIYNASRVVRVPGTRHPGSNLFKRQLDVEVLRKNDINRILELAKDTSTPFATPSVKLPQAILQLAKKEDIKINQERSFLSEGLDLSKRPPYLSPWKYAIEQGFFPIGTRNDAVLILASTYKLAGYSKTKAYYALKAACEAQSERFSCDKINKEDIYERVDYVYGTGWDGGCYAEDNFPTKLINYFEKDLGLPRKDNLVVDDFIVNIDKGIGAFNSYAKDIDKYSFKFGIKALDDILQVQLGHLVGLLAGPGVGKCHGKNTSILMFDGSSKMVQDVRIGDQLMGDDSTSRNVLSLAKGQEQMYRIHTDDGYYDVNESHMLSLKTTDNRLGVPNGGIINISVKDYLEKNSTFKRRTMGYRVPLKFTTKEVPFDPYLIGSWIGDGTRSKPEITHNDKQLEPVYAAIAQKHGLIYRTRVSDAKTTTHIFKTGPNLENPFRNYLRDNCLVNDVKTIPTEYILNSIENRWRLLAGLIDTDGHYLIESDCYEYTCKEKGIAEQIRFLCRSLGLKCTLRKKNAQIKSIDFKGVYWRLYIKGDLRLCPIFLDRKRQQKQNSQRIPTNYRIKIEKLQVDDYYGFELDGNHLYCLGDLSVTHNTSLGITLLNNVSRDGMKSFFASYDMYSNVVFQKLIMREFGLHSRQVFDVYRSGDSDMIDQFNTRLKDQYKNVSFCFKSGQTVQELRESIHAQEKKIGDVIKLVVVDYLELIQTKSSDPTQQSMEAIQGLREIANEGRVVVVLLQPNKLSSKPDEPLLSYNAAKGSSSIAQAVTAMITAHRPGLSSRTPENDRFFSVNIVKNRLGPLGMADFYWEGHTGKITDLDDAGRAQLQALRDFKDSQNNGGDDDI